MESIQIRPRSRTQRRVAQMRDAILDVAQGLLLRDGADGLSCEQVAAAADVSIQTVYNRVGRKDDLLMALAERALEENHRYMDAAYAHGGTSRERMEAALQGYFRFAFERPEAFLILAAPPQRVATARFGELVGLQNGRLADAIRAGQAEGEIDSNLDAAACATALWAMWNGLLISALQHDRYGLDEGHMTQALTMAGFLINRGLSTSLGVPTSTDTAQATIEMIKGRKSPRRRSMRRKGI